MWSSRLYPIACSWHGGLLDIGNPLMGPIKGEKRMLRFFMCQLLFFETSVFLIIRSRGNETLQQDNSPGIPVRGPVGPLLTNMTRNDNVRICNVDVRRFS